MRHHPEMEVSGITGRAVIQAFGSFTVVASRYLLDEGIGRAGADGIAQLEREMWYPLHGLLVTFERIRREFGDSVMQKIGGSMVSPGPGGGGPDQALKKGGAHDLDSSIRNLDRAFHRNHRLHGRILWDDTLERAREGIGSYGYEPVDGGRAILTRCDNPYPCPFDLGLISSLARRFEPTAHVVHDPGSCRSQGAESCTYRITWKGEPVRM